MPTTTPNLQIVISGLASLAIEITKTLEDGFQPLADAGQVWSAYQTDPIFKEKVEALVRAIPHLKDDFDNFDVSQLFALVLAIYPEVQLAIQQIVLLATKRKLQVVQAGVEIAKAQVTLPESSPPPPPTPEPPPAPALKG